MSRFYVGLFTIMTLAAVGFTGVVIPQLSEQSIAKAKKHPINAVNSNQKVTICHRPPDNPENYQTIEIDRSALQDHLSHGDLVCACDPDGDGFLCDVDQCDNDPNKTEPGVCGCGVADTDTDNDGTADCNDGCDNDPNKTAPGVCGCGTADADSDSDGIADCNDQCQGQADDADMDGYLSCVNDCDDNNSSVHPGANDAACDGIDSDCSEGIGGCEPLCKLFQCLGKGCEDVSDGCGGTITCDPIDKDGDNCDCLVDCNDNDPNIRPSNCNGDGIIKIDQECDGIDSDCSEGVGGCEPLCADFECAGAGLQCGTLPDGCGGTLECGPCDSGGCIFGQCCAAVQGCLTDPDGTLGGADCGLKKDQCGQFYWCEETCPDGLACNEETNKCEDPCEKRLGVKCEEMEPVFTKKCDANTGFCVNVGVTPCTPSFCDFSFRGCGSPDDCGGVCTACPQGSTCTLGETALAFRNSFGESPREDFCVPLCSSSEWECGPCLDCKETSLGTICDISENACDPGFLCEISVHDFLTTRYPTSECVADPDNPDATACQQSCNYRERCNPDTGKCECCAEDPVFGEICSVCNTDAFQVCATGAGGSVCCNQLNVANVCF
jgi:hypothetical protein